MLHVISRDSDNCSYFICLLSDSFAPLLIFFLDFENCSSTLTPSWVRSLWCEPLGETSGFCIFFKMRIIFLEEIFFLS